MKNLLIIILLGSLLGIIGCNNSPKSDKNSSNVENEEYLKTIEFIKSKISTYTENSYGFYWTFKIEIENCVLMYTTTEKGGKTDYTTVELNKLNPNNLKKWGDGPYYLDLKTKGNKKSVNKNNVNGYQVKTDHLNIYFDTKDDRLRAAKAFKWIIEHCGGEDEMYKASEEKHSSSNDPCDDFSYKELSRTEPMDMKGWYSTSIYIRTNNGKKIFIEQIVFYDGTTHYRNKSDDRKFGSIYNAAKSAVGCD